MTLDSASLVDGLAGWIGRRFSRRRFLQQVAVVGSAVTVSGWDYVLRPVSAYASVCGTGASCSSGWTAMCCTINRGVNQCPPGSFPGGWWKADGSSMCGGKARYYIDCQAECTRCGCPRGSHYCSSNCWNCHSYCASGTCDKRRVCHNLFRYGQCRRDIACSGPVRCRMITCTPPWLHGPCSSSSRTDNYTRSHSSTCLANTWTPMQARYTALGSQWSVLGASAGSEHAGHIGTTQVFQRGRMYYSKATGVHYLLGAIASKYVALRESGAAIGMPVSDTAKASDGVGRRNTFQRGVIYSHPSYGAHAVSGTILTVWTKNRREQGPLGYPRGDSYTDSTGGHHGVFQRGSVHGSAGTGSHFVLNPVHSWWTTHGGPTGSYGYPVTDTVTLSGGAKSNDFQHGAVCYSPAGGTHGVPTPVLQVWATYGRGAGPLGYPIAEIASMANAIGRSQNFQFGTIDIHPDFGNHAVWGPIFQAWVGNYGREGGQLGCPISDVYAVDSYHDACDFEHGTLTLDKNTGEVSLSS